MIKKYFKCAKLVYLHLLFLIYPNCIIFGSGSFLASHQFLVFVFHFPLVLSELPCQSICHALEIWRKVQLIVDFQTDVGRCVLHLK